MATVLKKDVVRESTETFKDKEIIITLTDKQEINLRLKGSKKNKKIKILDLFKELFEIKDLGGSDSGPLSIGGDKIKKDKGSVMIDLNQLRSLNAISTMDIQTVSKFDGIISECIKKMS